MSKEIVLLHLTLSGNSLKRDCITRIQIMRATEQKAILDVALPTNNHLMAFAKTAKKLYQQLQNKHILCIGADLKYAFLKQAYNSIL